jgi:molybdopterin-containing oxidoreductase family membrane subunit
MTLFAVTCAGLFPLFHLGRPWVFYWLFPYPNTEEIWPQFRSPLIWDVFAVSTYFLVSLMFWYAGLVPDAAAMRERAQSKFAKVSYGVLALGWRGSARHWQNHQMAYLLLGGLATPLVLSVHSIVGMDFAVAIVPGWHSAIFPPYFVAGAIFSGFAMVLTLAIPLRWLYGLEDFVTIRHLSNAAKIMLLTSSIVGYGYLIEVFMEYYSGDEFERAIAWERVAGPYAWSYWSVIVINVLVPQLFWLPRVRASAGLLFVLSLIIQVGMWLERFMIIVPSLHHDYLPSSWHMFYPTVWDITMLLGSIGLFFSLFYLFVRLLPMISISELRELLHTKQGHG